MGDIPINIFCASNFLFNCFSNVSNNFINNSCLFGFSPFFHIILTTSVIRASGRQNNSLTLDRVVLCLYKACYIVIIVERVKNNDYNSKKQDIYTIKKEL